jgi:hypothetical protein
MEKKDHYTRNVRDQKTGTFVSTEEHKSYEYDPPAPGRIPSPFKKGRSITPASHSSFKKSNSDGSKKS